MFTPSSLNYTVLSEGFVTSCPPVGPNNAPSLSCLQEMSNHASDKAAQIDLRLNDPIKNVSAANTKIGGLNEYVQYLRENPEYKYDGDSLDLPSNETPPTILSTYLQDNQEMIVHQNTMYILGTLTTSTLLIFALIMSSSSE